jgi:uncharacterized caspase-like protein
MKRNILTLLLIAIAVMSLNARTFVLATGVSNYGNEEINLSQTTKDAKRFKEVMATQTKDITLLTSRNVTHDNVLEKLQAICNRAQEGDRVIFFYSGHGMPGAICAYDRAISYEELVAVLSSSSASEKVCFIDACHAGTMAKSATDNSWTKSVKDKAGQIFFVSCRSDEYSAESPILGAGYFTQALLKGLRGMADTDNNKQITVIELFKYIYGDVLTHSEEKQHPQLIAPKSLYDVVISKW